MILYMGCPGTGAPSFFESLLTGRRPVRGTRACPPRDRQTKLLQEAIDPLKEDESLKGQRGPRKSTLLA